MPENAVCPSPEMLSAFVVGRINDAQAAEIETHLAVCPQCLGALENAAVDPLVVAVKASRETVEQAADSSVVEKFQIPFPLEDRAAQTTGVYLQSPDDTYIAEQRSETHDDTEELYGFLSPSAETGEIGRLGGYRVLSPLGKGGMGVVFRAEDEQLQRPVALKVMRSSVLDSSEASRRFLAEARAAAKLKHDHVVTIYQVGEDGGVPYIAMELLEGESLDSHLDRVGRLSIDEVCRIGIEALSALSAAQARGLVHRDIKPANLWLEQGRGRIKVLDFGLARATGSDANVTTSGAIVGTPAYMAPEQARGMAVDGRTDLFALGVVLYRALVGHVPFRGNNAVDTLMAVTTQTPAAPRSLRPEIPQRLSDLVLKLLEKEPARRPQTAAEVAEELAAIRAQGPTALPPRRRPWGAIAAGLLAVAAVLAVTIILRDKQGNKVAEVTVADGVSAEIRTTQEPAGQPKVGSTASDVLAEAPAFEEWRRGRKILTVAQDGTGEFQSIQEALNTLRPGQAIQVLGRGPYREQLKITELPPDTGLFSTSQAIIDCPGWQEVYKEPPDSSGVEKQVYSGHILNNPQGFRLHGIEWRFAPRGGRSIQPITMAMTENVVIENCILRGTDGDEMQFVNLANWDPASPGARVVVRDCVFEAHLWLGSKGEGSRCLVERNLFVGPAKLGSVVIADSRMKQVVVRQNVFVQHTGSMLTLARLEECDDLQIVNNTFAAPSAIEFVGKCPEPGRVAIHNNLLTGSRWFVIIHEEGRDSVLKFLGKGGLGHNAYVGSLAGPADVRGRIRSAGDYRKEVRLLSTDPDHPDYLRVSTEIPSVDPRGAEEDLPRSWGALPHGPSKRGGDWFARLRERWRSPSRIEPEPDSAIDRLATVPALEEWLKGRKVLTVSQDGQGQFRTIQEALEAVKPGQAIEVLDRGPYREALAAELLPDCGLYSTVQTVLELPEWKLAGQQPSGKADQLADIHQGHRFLNANGFRLHGFEFRFPPPKGTYREGKWHQRLTIRNVRDVVFENCAVRGVGNFDGDPVEMSSDAADELTEMKAVIRDCLIEGSLAINTSPKPEWAPDSRGANILLTRNCFPDTGLDHHLIVGGHSLERLTIRECLLAGRCNKNLVFASCVDRTAIEVSRCYLNSSLGISFARSVPGGAVVLRNNLRSGEGLVQFLAGAEKFRIQAQQAWNVEYNAYEILSAPTNSILKRGATDVAMRPQFLSTSLADRNAFRLAADDPLGKAGAEGQAASYIGPFPAGPAPAGGDWFTRLQERWIAKESSAADQTSATQLTEPPALEEWLKGRKVLTVSQDGRGQFHTIQEALEALKRGQAIEVLDRGPYREALAAELPPDCGLYTTVQTVLELPEWKLAWQEPVGKPGQLADVFHGHRFLNPNGFRLHGFEFRFPAPKGTYDEGKWHRRLTFRNIRDFVFENCAVRGVGNLDGDPLELSNDSAEDSTETTATIRDCLIEGSLALTTNSKRAWAPESRGANILVTRNCFPDTELDHHLIVAGESLERLTIRECLFAGRCSTNLVVARCASRSAIEVSHCYLTSTHAISFVQSVPGGAVVLRNNLRSGVGLALLHGGAEQFLSQAQQAWKVEYNAYPFVSTPTNSLLKRGATDVAMRPRFLSTSLAERNAFRLTADDPLGKAGAGGQAASYIGPFPAGPAPAEGDWFTRLQARWITAKATSSEK